MSQSSSRVSTGSTDFLLLMESGFSTSTTKSVSLGLSKTERRGTFSSDLEGVRGKDWESVLPFVTII